MQHLPLPFQIIVWKRIVAGTIGSGDSVPLLRALGQFAVSLNLHYSQASDLGKGEQSTMVPRIPTFLLSFTTSMDKGRRTFIIQVVADARRSSGVAR
ncbi:hypothetical protein K438DRAFT_520186 [Mycena galopus ATCC 62051]|nr:hypothetical protein K438DRAFT_520186 [Mycena galopus ATCC 62051]